MAANKGEWAGENPPPRIAVQIKGELYKTEHRAQHMQLSNSSCQLLLLLKSNKIIPRVHILKLHGLLKEFHLMK